MLDFMAQLDVVWIRSAFVETNGNWRPLLIEITGGAPPDNWNEDSWDYPQVRFRATQRSGSIVVRWLRMLRFDQHPPGEKRPLDLDAQSKWERRDSDDQLPTGPLPWPSMTVTLHDYQANREPQGMLVSDSAPSFLNFYNAAASFFQFTKRHIGGSAPVGVYFRFQDTSGRINHVRLSNSSIDVEVEGDDLASLTLELSGEVPGISLSLGSEDSQHRSFPLSGEIPAGAWILLRRSTDWIDRRFLNVPYSLTTAEDVEHVDADLPRLQYFITSREGPQVEFKLDLPAKDDKSKRKVMKTVGAFANCQGGSILFGIDDEEYEIVGLPTREMSKYRDILASLVRSWINPVPPFDFRELEIEGDNSMSVLELVVSKGNEPPYGVGTPGNDPEYFIRHFASSVRARPGELRAVIPAPLTSPVKFLG